MPMDPEVIRRTLLDLREEAGISQADLAKRLPFTASRVSRLESGDIAISEDDAREIATAIGTPRATAFAEYLHQHWRILEKPGFNHTSRQTLWEAEQALYSLHELEDDPELKNAFLQQVSSCKGALERTAQFLLSTQHQIAFFGSPGVGKTTGICALADLEKQTEKDLKGKMVLPTGSGRTTICEVHVRRGGDYSIIVDPCSIEEVRQYVADFSEQVIRSAKGGSVDDGTDAGGVAAEVERALRNMAGLRKKTSRTSDGKIKREDPAIDLVVQYPAREDLQVQILSRLDLTSRVQTSVSMPRESVMSGLDWIERTFAEINDGKNPDFSLPRRIEVTVPAPIFGVEEFDLRLIDTRGIDEPSAPRRDVQTYLDDPRTVPVFCSSFKDAPDAAMLALLERATESGLLQSVKEKGILLVLPLDREESDVRDNVSGDADEGREIRKEQIATTLSHVRAGDLQVEFLNVLDKVDRDNVKKVMMLAVSGIRARHEEQVRTLVSTVEGLIRNKADEQAKAVFDAATRQLRVWFANNQSVPKGGEQPPEALLEKMNGLRYAASLRASINRFGNWDNFDYWLCLGFGARREAVARSTERVTVLKGFIENAFDDPESMEVHDFLRHFRGQVEDAVLQFYKDVQALGETVFLEQLKADLGYWNTCSNRWGGGPGYKSDIGRWTGDWFSKQERRHRYEFIEQEIQRMWRELITKLDQQVTSQRSQEGAEAA